MLTIPRLPYSTVHVVQAFPSYQLLSVVLLPVCHHLQNVSYSDTCVVCLLSPTAIFPFRNCIQYFKRVKHYPFCIDFLFQE